MSATDGYNSDIKSEQVQKLAELFPEVVSGGKVDFGALKATLGEDIELGEKYGLSWKGKSSVFAKIQEKTVSTLHPQPDESVDWDTTQNMFIEGDNLEALKVLHKAYYGKIKMIYIDPPYNTGNDFVYNDDFAKTRRQNAMDEGLLDEEGNATRDDGLRVNTGGHKHSNWLDMMYPRLFLARNLLRQDGVIFVSIDDNEVHNLRLMMNEIFGEENFVAQIIWKNKFGAGAKTTGVIGLHEYILVYCRNANEIKSFSTPLSDKTLAVYNKKDEKFNTRGPYGTWPLATTSMAERKNLMYPIIHNNEEVWPSKQWLWSKERVIEAQNNNELVFSKQQDGSYSVRFKGYLLDENGKQKLGTPTSIIDDIYTQDGTKDIRSLFSEKVFDFPKPVAMIKRLLSIQLNEDDGKDAIVLDFFGGSGTLAQAVGELNAEDGGDRKWLTVQLPELTDEKSEAQKAGYKTIAEIARERIRRAGTKISKDFADKITERETPLDLGFRSYVLGDSNFKKWNEQMRNPTEIRQATLGQLNPIEDSASDADLLAEILLKRGISPLVEMETHEDFIFIPSKTLAISLSRHMTEDLFATILAKSPSQIILLDQAFRDDVNLKTNLILQAEQQNIAVEVL